MIDEPIENVIARSTLGGSAWCATCNHPDLLHEEIGCIEQVATSGWDMFTSCPCEVFVPMTADEWLRRRA